MTKSTTPSQPAARTHTIWLVWSHVHGAWWRPNGAGYTSHLKSAGRYTASEAEENCNLRSRSTREDAPPPEVAVIAPEFAQQHQDTAAALAKAKTLLTEIALKLGSADWGTSDHAEEILNDLINRHYRPIFAFLQKHATREGA